MEKWKFVGALELKLLVINSNQVSESYYDWQLNQKINPKTKKRKKKRRLNNLGIEENEFKQFIKKWKKENNL